MADELLKNKFLLILLTILLDSANCDRNAWNSYSRNRIDEKVQQKNQEYSDITSKLQTNSGNYMDFDPTKHAQPFSKLPSESPFYAEGSDTQLVAHSPSYLKLYRLKNLLEDGGQEIGTQFQSSGKKFDFDSEEDADLSVLHDDASLGISEYGNFQGSSNNFPKSWNFPRSPSRQREYLIDAENLEKPVSLGPWSAIEGRQNADDIAWDIPVENRMTDVSVGPWLQRKFNEILADSVGSRIEKKSSTISLDPWSEDSSIGRAENREASWKLLKALKREWPKDTVDPVDKRLPPPPGFHAIRGKRNQQ